MELMDNSLDKVYKLVYHDMKKSFPEKIIGKMAVAVSEWNVCTVFIMNFECDKGWMMVIRQYFPCCNCETLLLSTLILLFLNCMGL